MSVDLVIVYSPVGGGHRAAALATAEAARARGLSALVIDLFEHAPRILGGAYRRAHLTWQSALPDLYGSAFFAANHRGGPLEPVRRGVDHVAFGAVTDRVARLAPRAVIATHHLPLVVLGRARRRGRLEAPLVGVVTDYIAHACWAERGVDAFSVPSRRAARDLAAHGVDARRVARTGIPVRPAFERLPRVVDPGPSEPLRVLVTSGGFGVGPIRAVVRSFHGIPRVRLTVVCGAAGRLAAAVRRDASRLGIDAEVVGFERDMPARLAAAHLVVGKAGGLTVSEALAAGRPMILTGTVPGNESVNEDYVVRGGAGCAAAPADVGRIAAALRGASCLAAMGDRARRLVVHDAAANVVGLALAMSGAARVLAA